MAKGNSGPLGGKTNVKLQKPGAASSGPGKGSGSGKKGSSR